MYNFLSGFNHCQEKNLEISFAVEFESEQIFFATLIQFLFLHIHCVYLSFWLCILTSIHTCKSLFPFYKRLKDTACHKALQSAQLMLFLLNVQDRNRTEYGNQKKNVANALKFCVRHESNGL